MHNVADAILHNPRRTLLAKLMSLPTSRRHDTVIVWKLRADTIKAVSPAYESIYVVQRLLGTKIQEVPNKTQAQELEINELQLK